MSRLNALLKNCALFTADELEEAQNRREQLGGSLADCLFYVNSANEEKILEAMSQGLGWKTVALSEVKPPAEVLALIPGAIGWEARVLPFAIDNASSTIRCACRNPEDSETLTKLESLLSGRQVVLHAAVGAALDYALIDCYRQEISDPKSSNSEINPGESDQFAAEPDTVEREKTALLIDPDEVSNRHFVQALIDEDYLVVICQTPTEALEEFENRRPRLVLIRDVHRVRYQKLLERTSLLTPDCVVRFYSDLTDLLSPVRVAEEWDLLLNTNLHLAATAMASLAGQPPENAARTAGYVERLCHRLDIDSYNRLILVSTAYQLDISRLYFRELPVPDRENSLYRMLTIAGNNLIHSPAVLKVIRRMYPDLAQMKADDVRSLETFHGNILTVVDFYLRQFGSHKRLTPHRFESIQQNLRAQVGEIFLPEIAETFLDLLQEEVDYTRHDRSPKRILVLDELGVAETAMTGQMREAGFDCAVAVSSDQFLYMFSQRRPDFIVITARGSSDRVQRLISSLAASGIVFPDIPSFVFHETTDFGLISPLLEAGLRDVLRFTGDSKILRIRLQQILAARERESLERLQVFQDMGTHGSLEHMNVIDLLQAVGPGDKTLRISVTAWGQQLTMYLDHGKLLYAECEGNTGAKAIFEALSWDAGIWSVDHISQSELPEPNNERSIDSILIEGCTYIDELGRDKGPAEQPPVSPDSVTVP